MKRDVIMIYRAINGLIRHAIEADLITNDDIFVVRNQLMDILKLTDWNDKVFNAAQLYPCFY